MLSRWLVHLRLIRTRIAISYCEIHKPFEYVFLNMFIWSSERLFLVTLTHFRVFLMVLVACTVTSAQASMMKLVIKEFRLFTLSVLSRIPSIKCNDHHFQLKWSFN